MSDDTVLGNLYASPPPVPGPQGEKGADGEQGIPGVQGIQGIPGAVGPAGLSWKGVWSSGIAYEVNDSVSYVGTNGISSSYFAIQAGTNHAPAEGGANAWWAMLAMEGAQGAQGPQGDPASNLVTSVNGQQGPVSITPQNIGAATSGDLDNTFGIAQAASSAAATADAKAVAAQGTANNAATAAATAQTKADNAPTVVKAATVPSYAAPALGLFNSDRGSYNVKASNTRRWRKGMGIALTGGYLNEVILGDSILGGCVDVAAGTFDRLNTVGRQYARLLSARTGVAQAGPGTIRMADGTRRDTRVVTAGVNQANCTGITLGQTIVVSPAFAGDTVTVIFYDNAAAAAAAFTISIDGASSGANFKTVTYVANDSKWKSVTMTGVTMTAASTITITSTRSSGPAYIATLEAYKSGGGIRVHDLEQSGTNSASWVASGTGFNAIRIFVDGALTFVPDVVHVGFGLFDWDGTRTPADMITSLVSIRSRFPNSDFVLHADPVPLSLTDAQWLPFIKGYFDAADQMDVPLLDLQNVLGGGTIESGLGLTGDATAHLKKEAYGIWARALAQMGQ